MHLLVDVGNTRAKWAVSDGTHLTGYTAVDHGQIAAELRAYIDRFPSAISATLVANVAGPAIAQVLALVIRECTGQEPTFLQSPRELCGVHNAYRVPEKLGIDRLTAMIGARYTLPSESLCVVCVGTAMTIDAVDRTGQHLGGLIVPGPQLMVGSLYAQTSDIGQRAAGGKRSQGFLAIDTLGAVEQGAEQALAALIDRIVVSLKAQLSETPKVVMTGGAAKSIRHLVSEPIIEIPDLVLRGLAVVAQQRV